MVGSSSGSPVGDPRFFACAGPRDLLTITRHLGIATPDRMLVLRGIAPLHTAGPDQIAFLDNRKYLDRLRATQAGAVIVHPDLADQVPTSAVALATDAPYRAWAQTAALFHPDPPPTPGRHPTACIDPDAFVDPSAEIGPFAVLGAHCTIGPRCRVGPHAAIGPGVAIGADCRIGAHVSVSHAELGDRVTLHPGVRIGQDGFGFDHTPGENGYLSVPQLGRVMLHHDVNIGANTTIDRGSVQDTVIGAGSRIDNLVQIGHNVRLGRCCVVVSQAGISGSTVLDDFVVVAGQAGLIGHLTIGRAARIGAQAGVMGDVAAGAEMIGSPAQPKRAFFREIATLRRLAGRHRAGSAMD